MKRYVIGNWKANKTEREVVSWFTTFAETVKEKHTIFSSHIHIVVCPPTLYLPLAKKLRDTFSLPIELGAQDISSVVGGAYTGEVVGSQLQEYVTHVLIGHSERRMHFHDTEEKIQEKVKQAIHAGISPVLCVSDSSAAIPKGVALVAFEPLFAIGSGKAATPEHADSIAAEIQSRHPSVPVIYGGSVTKENCKTFVAQKHIAGLLPGGASLDPIEFMEIILHVVSS